ncbi:MAG: LysR family transcriptional regulator [Actinomycetota bacterium]
MPTSLPDLSIRQLEYLVAVSTEPSWADAAATVGVSPSALSQGLSELERRVGVPLFDRDGRRRTLRPAAEPVLAHARQVVALTGDLADWAERTRTGRAGELRVGMIDAAAVGHYPDLLRRFRDEHPGLHLTLRVAPSGELLDEVEAGDLDLAVVVEGHGRRGVRTESLRREPLAVFTPTRGLPRRVEDWGPWVLFAEGSHTRAIAESALRRLGAPTTIVAESNQPEVLRTMVELGVGSTVLPVVQAGPAFGPGRVIAERTLVLARRDGTAADPAAEMLADALRTAASG